jgi:hypothetical protein
MSQDRASTILRNLGRQGWKITAGWQNETSELLSLPALLRPGITGRTVYTITAFRQLEGGHVKVEVEGCNPIVLVDDLLSLCEGLVVTA